MTTTIETLTAHLESLEAEFERQVAQVSPTLTHVVNADGSLSMVRHFRGSVRKLEETESRQMQANPAYQQLRQWLYVQKRMAFESYNSV